MNDHLSNCCKAPIKNVSMPGGNYFSICSQCDQECELIPAEQEPDPTDCGNKDPRVICKQRFCKSCKNKVNRETLPGTSSETPEMAAIRTDPVNTMMKASELGKYNMKEDLGHVALLDDIHDLLFEARKFQFHDFKNSKYSAPKVELRRKLLELSDNVVQGKYDNTFTQEK